MRITIAVHAPDVADANAWARCLGEGPDDGPVFGEAIFPRADGNLFAVASGTFSEGFLSRAEAPPVAPAWPVDLVAATRAQALLARGAAAAPGVIAAVIEEDPQTALELLGLRRPEIEVPE
ncbi:MAG: hypothetical protein HZT43_08445 [Exiguobacterium profundum]|nr:MAG: hypothetical protein HZT43_08445 [Exiguobacterium profundum]